jgi:hypothetical protein
MKRNSKLQLKVYWKSYIDGDFIAKINIKLRFILSFYISKQYIGEMKLINLQMIGLL